MITIIYHESFLPVSGMDLFESQLSMEMRFCTTTTGRILECNRRGKHLIDQYGDSFLDFFEGDSISDARRYLETLVESDDVISTLLNDRTNTHGIGTLFNGISKDGKLFIVGYNTALLTRFTAEFAHELRNPLTVIKGFVQLSGYTQEFDKYQPTILSEIDRMHNILENFLALSRKRMKLQKMLPEQVCTSLISIVSSECILKSIYFDYDVALSKNYCNIDLSMIKQVMLNLLRNAIEALEEDDCRIKKVFFRGAVADDGYRFALSDNGPGIETSVIQKIGKPFFTTKSNGTGIGLSLCKKIIADHQGSFCISSVPGNGTTVSFILPFVS